MKIPETLQELWSNLPEKQKKQFALSIYEHIPKSFGVWARKAGLAAGFRIQKVAARQVQPDRLDKVFFTIGDGTFAKEMFGYYLKALDNVLHVKGLEILLGIDESEPERLSRALEILEGECINDPWIGIYVAMVEWEGPEWFGSLNPDSLEGGVADLPQPGELASWQAELRSCVGAIKADLQSIEIAREVNKDEIHDRMDKAFRLGDEFRSKLKRASETMNQSSLEWKTIEELQQVVDRLEERMVIRDKEEVSRQWLHELATFLNGCGLEHRRLQRRQELEKLHQSAITELQKQSTAQEPFVLPGMEGKDPRAWTEWMVGLEGEEFDAVLTQLSNNFPSLAEFFGEITVDNLLMEEGEEEPDTPVVPDSDTVHLEGNEQEGKPGLHPSEEVLEEEQVGTLEPDGETLERITEEAIQAGVAGEAPDPDTKMPIPDSEATSKVSTEDAPECSHAEQPTEPAPALASKIRELSRKGDYLPAAMLAASLGIGCPTYEWEGPDFGSLVYAYRSLDGIASDSAPEWAGDPESCKAAPADSARLTFLIAIYRSMLGDASVYWHFHETAMIFLTMFKEWPDLRAWLGCAWHVSSETGLWDMLRQGEKGETLAKELDRQMQEFQKLHSECLLHKVPKGAYSNRVRYIMSMSHEMQWLSKYLKTLSPTAMGKDELSKMATYLRRKPKTFMDDWFEHIGRSLDLTDYQKKEVLEDVMAYLDTALQAFKAAETKRHLEQEKGEKLGKLREYRETLGSRAETAVSQAQGKPWEAAFRANAREALLK